MNSNFISFYPPKRILMGPGPSDISPRVLAALSRPTIGHLDPQFIELMGEIKQLLQYAFQTRNEVTFPVSAPGSAGMESCLINIVEPGDKVLVCINGVFGQRMQEVVQRCGGEAVVVEDEWGCAVDPQKVEDALKKHRDIQVVAFVHAETSTGAMSDAETLAQVARQYDCLTVVDAVTSLAGCALKVDAWQLDAVYSGTQKCLSCPPGLSPVTFSERAVEKIKNRKSRVQSWFMDLNLVLEYWGEKTSRSYHHTAPVNALYGLHEALLMLREEGLENAWQRHKAHAELLIQGIEQAGLNPFVAEAERLPQLISILVPEGVDEAKVRCDLLNRYNLEIGAGLGILSGKVWRVGLMGYSSTESNILICCHALTGAMSINI